MTDRAFDLVVVGAGVIGLSIAYQIKRRNPELRITLLGDPMHSLNASRAAAGMLAPFCECEKGDRFFRFCRESLDKYPDFVEELVRSSGVKVHLSMAGSLMPANSMGDQWDERLRFFREEDVPHEVWSAQKVREKLPYLAPDVGDVIWVGEGQINNRQLHDALAAACNKLGIEAQQKDVTGFRIQETSLAAAVTDSGEVAGKQFVLAAGSWSAQLAKMLGVSVPMRPIKGQMCRVQLEDHMLDYTIHGMCTYVAPWRQGNGFVLGSTMEDKGFDSLIEDDTIQGLIDRAAEILPGLRNAPLLESWAGLRPAAEDRMPIMGASGKYENLFYSTGHFRNGILQTPNQADYLADLITGARTTPIPEFDPARYDL